MDNLKRALIWLLRKIFLPIFIPILSEPKIRRGKQNAFSLNKSTIYNCRINENVKYEIPYYFEEVEIGKFTYIAKNASIKGNFVPLAQIFFVVGGFTLQME